MRNGWGRGLMGQECRKGAPGVRRYKGGATGEGEEKQPKQLEKMPQWSPNSSYVNKKLKLKTKRPVGRKTGKPSPTGLCVTKENILEENP